MTSTPNQDLFARPTNELLAAFGAGKPSPGSGSAAAFMGILAAKLVQTVCLKSLEKVKPSQKSAIEFILEESRLREAAIRTLFEQDSTDFDEVVRFRRLRMNAESKSEQARYARLANQKLEETAATIKSISRACMDLVDHALQVFEIGWPHIRGEAGAAASVALSGAMSCVFVASLNAKTLKGRQAARQIQADAAALTQEIQEKQISAFRCAEALSVEAVEVPQLIIESLTVPASEKAK